MEKPTFWCSLCSKDLQSQAALVEHEKGRKHLKKMGALKATPNGQGAKGPPPDWIGRVPQDFVTHERPLAPTFPKTIGKDSIQHTDFYCIVDFEATCGTGISRTVQEVIEFPAVLLDVRGGAKNATVVAEFQRYFASQC